MVPNEIQGKGYVSLTTFRKNGAGVATPVWFAEDAGKLYVMSGNNSGKHKRIRNNPKVQVAPCTIRGRVTGPQFPGVARVLPSSENQRIRGLINQKYWLARIPFFWSKDNIYLEIAVE